ncbi:transcriptional regulator [Marinobacterium nitratireducens]|uniref:Transcriptional regulator n=1 Tax=Marinobacterium nitratireducens TaxID=518897 RepID=A0A917ZJ07_9GAMM|nr:LysR family transcriptional regulator [Marinobacterium nitratireducens]GGO83551.1 transcriptional regulator [Marinobacterium nitratireducens]
MADMNPLRKFDLNLLVVFETLIVERHVTRTAERLYLSQPAVSHALRRLREALDDPLLVKTERGMQPTPRALELLPGVQQALKLIDRTLTPPPAFDPATSRRRFVIATNDYFEELLYPGFLASVQPRAPHLEFAIEVISQSVLCKGLENREVDLVVGLEADTELPSTLMSEPWIREELVCLVARSNRVVGDSLSLEDFVRQPQIGLSQVGAGNPEWVDQWLSAQGLERRLLSRSLNYMAAARTVALTDAVLTLPRELAMLFCTLLPLRLVQPPAGMPRPEMTLVHHPLYERDGAIRWLRAELQDCAQNMTGS